MALRKYLTVFITVFLIVLAAFVGFNVVTDPFGVFGDKFMKWYDYDMTMNPRVAKIGYLDRHYKEYDSYILGSSKASSIPVEELNQYMDASFYNMTWYGGDLKDEEQLAKYITEHYNVKNLVLLVDPQDAVSYDFEEDKIKGNMHCKVDDSSKLKFYSRYLFANPSYGIDKIKSKMDRGYLVTAKDVYVAETGCYNKQKRDATPIGNMDEYMEAENNSFYQEYTELPYLSEAIISIGNIKKTCEEHGVKLIVIGPPIHQDEFYKYNQDQMQKFIRDLTATVDYYDFWGYNQINCDMRYYYDTNHFRNAVGKMVLAYIFHDDNVYLPSNFGHVTTSETLEQRIQEIYGTDPASIPKNYTAKVPILLFHSFTKNPKIHVSTVVQAEKFDGQMKLLKDNGYHTINYYDLINYVYHGLPLPDKPVLISFDDGYRDNLEIAAPILKKYGYKATISIIGASVGKESYKDTGEIMTPHFEMKEALPYVKSGTIDIQSHTFDMHQVEELDGKGCRQGVLQMDGESDEEYVKALSEDFKATEKIIEDVLPVSCEVVTYPYGFCDLKSDVILKENGVKVTVGLQRGVNEIVKGLPQSLIQLKRFNISNDTTPDELLGLLKL